MRQTIKLLAVLDAKPGVASQLIEELRKILSERVELLGIQTEAGATYQHDLHELRLPKKIHWQEFPPKSKYGHTRKLDAIPEKGRYSYNEYTEQYESPVTLCQTWANARHLTQEREKVTCKICLRKLEPKPEIP